MKKISELEKAEFCEQMAMVLDGGITVEDGIDAIVSQVEDQEYKKVLQEIQQKVENGIALSKAMKETNLYDEYLIHMIEVGESSGYLDRIFKETALYYHRTEETKTKIKNALTYPGILITMMLVVIIVMLVKILPMFQSVLGNMGIALSGVSMTIFSIGKNFAILSLVILMVVFVVCAYTWVHLKVSGKSLTSVLQKFFFTKKLAYELSVVQFAYALSLLLNSGIHQEDAFEMCMTMCEDDVLKKKIENIVVRLKNNDSLQECILQSHIFKEIYNRLLVIGLKSGHFEETMNQVAKAYEEDIDYRINQMLDMIEPSLIALLSLIVGMILLSVMLPLIGIMANL